MKDKITNRQKLFLGPVYSTYEFMTPYGTRLNNKDWEEKHKNYKPLDFNS